MLTPGRCLGPYEIVSLIGAGGMGEVYRARDPRLGRDVALKIIRGERVEGADGLRRFEREARAIASLNHPSILTVHDVGTDGGTAYVVTELLEGETLREACSSRAPTPRQIVAWAVQVAQGLAAAHQKGIVHRDLKPENLFLTADGRVKILDFGLAKRAEAASADDAEATEQRTTRPGALMGTVAYMSPEQVRALGVDARSDVFSFGVVLYELLSRRHPFQRKTAAATLTAILQDTPTELSSVDAAIPAALGGMVRRCLEKEREDRFQSAHDLALALEAVLASPSGAPSLREVEERSPYPGLASFTERDAAVFFGREAEVEALWRRLESRKLLAVIGPSGAGKTSFLRAGVIPARPEGWGAARATPGARPALGLAQSLTPELAGDAEAVADLLRGVSEVAESGESEWVVSAVKRWRSRHGDALLVVDQLEELFTLCPGETQRRFAALLGRLASEADVHVVLSLRDDFLIRCSEHEPLAPVFESLTPLPGLTPDGLRRALVEPAKTRGYRFEDEALVDEMVESVEGARGALPLLAFAVARLWEKRDRERKLLTRAAYDEIAGVAGALAQHAEATMDRIGTERQAIVREIFRNLVTSQGTRAVAEREELLSAFPQKKDAEQVLRELIDARLLTAYEVEGKEGEPSHHRVEVVHESLLKAWPRLVRWQMQDEEGAVLRDQLRQAAHLWQERSRTGDLLWTGTAYQEYVLWRGRYAGALTALEEEFARAMAERAQRQRRLRRWVAAGIAASLVAVLSVVSVLWRRAVLEGRRAEAARLVALGRVELDRYPTAAVAYARRSLEVADTASARALAVEALWRAPSARILPVAHGGASGTAFSWDGSALAAYTYSENILVVSRDGGAVRRLGGFPAPSYPAPVGLSPDGKVLVTFVDKGNYVRLSSTEDGREVGRLSPERLGLGRKPFGWLGWAAARNGIVLFWRESSSPTSKDSWLLWPWDGSGARRLPVVMRPDLSGFDWGLEHLATARDGRLFVRPFLGGLDTPERQVAAYDPSSPPGTCFSLTGERLATRDGKDVMNVFDLGSRSPTRRWVLRQPRPDGQFVGCFDEKGERIVWGSSSERVVSMWDLEGPPDAEPLALRRSDAPEVKGADFVPRGSWLAALNSSSLTFWQVGQPWTRVIRGHSDSVYQVVFTNDSRWLLSCGFDNLRRWPLDPMVGEARTVETLSPSPNACYGAAVAPDGREVARAMGGVQLVPLHGRGGRWLVTEKWPTDSTHDAVAFDASGRWVAAGVSFSRPGTSKRLRVWERSSSVVKYDWPLEAPGEPESPYAWVAHRVAFLDERRVLVAGSAGLRRFDVETGTSEWLWKIDRGISADMAVSSDGRLVAAAGFPGQEAPDQWAGPVVLDLAAGSRREILTHGTRVWSVALDAGGRVLVTGGNDGVVRVGRPDGSAPHLLFGHTGPVVTVAVSPDGRWIASAAGSEIRLWPMPDIAKPPLHTLPHGELMAELQALTNLRVVEDPAAATGYKLDIGPFPGWKDAPTW